MPPTRPGTGSGRRGWRGRGRAGARPARPPPERPSPAACSGRWGCVRKPARGRAGPLPVPAEALPGGGLPAEGLDLLLVAPVDPGGAGVPGGVVRLVGQDGCDDVGVVAVPRRLQPGVGDGDGARRRVVLPRDARCRAWRCGCARRARSGPPIPAAARCARWRRWRPAPSPWSPSSSTIGAGEVPAPTTPTPDLAHRPRRGPPRALQGCGRRGGSRGGLAVQPVLCWREL